MKRVEPGMHSGGAAELDRVPPPGPGSDETGGPVEALHGPFRPSVPWPPGGPVAPPHGPPPPRGPVAPPPGRPRPATPWTVRAGAVLLTLTGLAVAAYVANAGIVLFFLHRELAPMTDGALAQLLSVLLFVVTVRVLVPPFAVAVSAVLLGVLSWRGGLTARILTLVAALSAAGWLLLDEPMFVAVTMAGARPYVVAALAASAVLVALPPWRTRRLLSRV